MIGIRSHRPPRPRSRIRCGLDTSTITVSIHSRRRAIRIRADAPTPLEVEALEPELADEVIGEGGAVGEVADELEDALARRVDRSLDRDRTHGRAILLRERSSAIDQIANVSTSRKPRPSAQTSLKLSPVFGMSLPLFGMDTVVDGGADVRRDRRVRGSRLARLRRLRLLDLAVGGRQASPLPGVRRVALSARLDVRVLDHVRRRDHPRAVAARLA